jgi:hypothetical protein
MTRRFWLCVLLAVLAGAVTAAAQPVFHLRPFRLVLFSAIDAGPAIGDRYGVVLIEDQATPDLCLAIVTDRVTGQFTATAVTPDACRRQ